jgi:S1-C subfamily serine protease
MDEMNIWIRRSNHFIQSLFIGGENMKNKKLLITSIIVLMLFSVTACAGFSSLPFVKNNVQPNVKTTVEENNAQAVPTATLAPEALRSQSLPATLDEYQTTLESVYQQVNPSVVNIQVVKQVSMQNNNLDPNNSSPMNSIPQSGEGSGFIWDTEGHIVTNNHVVESASDIQITFSDGTILPAKVVGTDSQSDLAVVKVDAPADLLKPVQLADSTKLKVGQVAIAIGNPFGLQGTMTVGIVSALGRSLSVDSGASLTGSYTIPDIIQTDAPINPGNSGGVLVNDAGQVIGVTSAIESPVEANAGVGFAIPAAIVQRVVPSLIENGKYDHPYLGISGTSLTPTLAKAMNLSSDQRGALVSTVTSGGPADKAGLKGSDKSVQIEGSAIKVGGDVITAMDGETIKSMDDLIATLASNYQVGQKATLTVLRNGKEQSIDITLGARPTTTETTQANQPQQPQSSGQVYLGIVGLNLTSELAKAMNVPEDQAGVLIQQVEGGSPADKAGLQGSFKPTTISGQRVLIGGDIIVKINGQAVTNMEDLRSQLTQSKPGDEITVTVLRDGNNKDVKVTLGEKTTTP